MLTTALGNAAAVRLSAPAPDWLASGIACDIVPATAAQPSDIRAELLSVIDGAQIDIVIQETTGRRKRLLVADMDSTMIQQECVDELAVVAGIGDRVAAITARAMNGEIAFEPALRERVALLEGLPLSVIDRVLEERIELAPGGRTLVATMRANGAHTALVSGGFTHFTRPIAAMLGFDENRANVLIEAGGALAGTVAEPVLGQQAKIDTLQQLANRLGLSLSETMAVGDGANDLGMIQLAGTGVALHAKPVVAEKADIRIDHGDLTALLYIQGYRRSDMVEPT